MKPEEHAMKTGELPLILHLLVGSGSGGCEHNCQLFCEYSSHFQHVVMTLGAAGDMTGPWNRVAKEVIHLDILTHSRPARAEKLRKAVGYLSQTPAVVMLWHGMIEMPFILHGLRNWQGPVFAHAGNPQIQSMRGIDLRFLIAQKIWSSPHRPTFICCSDYVATSLARSWYLRQFSRVAVPNGVRPPTVHHVPRNLAPDSAITVGMLARLDWIKDHATVLRAVALVRDQIPGLRIEFAGDGPERGRLSELAAELNIEDAVQFLGKVDAIYETISKWDVFIYATTKNEGFGNALAEALMCGLPSIVTDIGPMRTVCGEDEEGAVFYVSPGDASSIAKALTRLVSDLPLRQNLGESARRRAEREFSSGKFAERYEQIFASGNGGTNCISPASKRFPADR